MHCIISPLSTTAVPHSDVPSDLTVHISYLTAQQHVHASIVTSNMPDYIQVAAVLCQAVNNLL